MAEDLRTGSDLCFRIWIGTHSDEPQLYAEDLSVCRLKVASSQDVESVMTEDLRMGSDLCFYM